MFGLFVAAAIFAFVGSSHFREFVSDNLSTKVTIKEEVKGITSKIETEVNDSEESEVNVKIEVESESEDSNKPSTSPLNDGNLSNISEFIYPNSKSLSSEQNKVLLRSSDNPSTITSWYKEKINEKKLNATSFVTTSTNGLVLNKLAADGAFKIEVEIKKEANSEVEIAVSLSD